MNLNRIKSTLTKLAKQHKTRRAFNRAVKGAFPYINDGAFRIACDAGAYVVKVRQSEDQGCFGMDDIDVSNEQERDNYENLKSKLPSLAFFVVEPVYVKLPNGHDAILTRKVAVVCTDKDYSEAYNKGYDPHAEEDEVFDLPSYARVHFTTLMQEQYDLITDAFCDTHDDNIGWDFKTNRVWLIDYNHGAGIGESEYRRRATTTMKRVIRSSGKAKAA